MKKETKKIIFIILIVLSISLIGYVLLLGYKYINHIEIIGEYELVDNTQNNKLKISLYKWEEGDKKNLKCDLWNCTGYNHGTYKISNKKIRFYLNANTIFNNNSVGTMDYEYKIKKEGKNTYLIMSSGNSKYIKYKRIDN